MMIPTIKYYRVTLFLAEYQMQKFFVRTTYGADWVYDRVSELANDLVMHIRVEPVSRSEV